jgi:peptidoglycan/xylan/chitin deacetylase (PgdA/CDA1 family)
MKPIDILVTMDCEPIRPPERTGVATSGPYSYADSERFITGYAKLARSEYGFPVSLFIHPESALAHRELFPALERDGAALGLHIHPYKYDPVRYCAHFGELSAEDQRTLVAECSALWKEALGRRPEYFRPGTFSANDSTFRVLAEMGFIGGSISCPGRMFPELAAVWTGAPCDPHRGHAHFRQLVGELPFANLPLSVDTSDVRAKDGSQQQWDLRPDYREADYTRIATNIVTQIKARNPAVPIVMVVSHNDNDYTDPNDRVAKNLRRSLDATVAACRAAGYEPRGATIAEVCAKVLALPPAVPEWVIGRASIQAG